MTTQENNLIGKYVRVKDDVDSQYAGEWGVVIGFDGEEYTIRHANGNTYFYMTRKEIIVYKNQEKIEKAVGGVK